MGKSKFTISLLGFDERSVTTLSQATSRTMKIIDPIVKGETQVVVVDIDGEDGHDIWNNFRQQWPHMPAVVVCVEDPDFEDASFAQKPFTAESLIDNITEAIILSPSEEEHEAADAATLTETETTEASSQEDVIDTDKWFGSDAEVTEPSYEMDALNLELTNSGSQDYLSEKETSDEDTTGKKTVELRIDEFPTDAITESQAETGSLPEIDIGETGESQDEKLETLATEEAFSENRVPESDQKTSTDKTTAEEPVDEMDKLFHDAMASAEKKATEKGESDKSADLEQKVTTPSIEDMSASKPSTTEKEMRPLSEIANILTLRSSITGELPNRALDSPNPEETFFNPDAHMISLVLKGVSESAKTGNIAKLACLLDRTIYIDAQNKIINSNLKDIHMRQIAIAPLGKGENGLDSELEMLNTTSFPDSDGSTYPMRSFIWELALLTSKGRVPVGTPMDKPTYLMQWPNFSRLMHVPNDMKIAAYWLRLPSSLNDLSENLNVPIDNVRLMYSATFLTGLAGIATRKSDYMLRLGKPEEHENRNLFGSFMNKFKK